MSRAPWNNIAGGSPHPEWWLSNSGQVAQTASEYSVFDICYYKEEMEIKQLFEQPFSENIIEERVRTLVTVHGHLIYRDMQEK